MRPHNRPQWLMSNVRKQNTNFTWLDKVHLFLINLWGNLVFNCEAICFYFCSGWMQKKDWNPRELVHQVRSVCGVGFTQLTQQRFKVAKGATALILQAKRPSTDKWRGAFNLLGVKERVEGWMLCAIHVLNTEDEEPNRRKWMSQFITSCQATSASLFTWAQYHRTIKYCGQLRSNWH